MGYTDGNGNHLALTKSQLAYKVSADMSKEENLKTVMNYIFSQKLTFKPGSQFEYSNSNYLLLAKIVEQVSGMSYEEYLRKHIFQPLGMEHTGFVDDMDSFSNLAQPKKTESGLEYLSYPGMSFGAGNMVSSVNDMAKWLDELTAPKILTKEIINSMSKNRSSEDDTMQYGFGLMVSRDDEYVYHSGYIPSFASMVLVSPEKNLKIILFTNCPTVNPEGIAKRLYNELTEGDL